MNFIYDLLLNFSDTYMESYEWNETDRFQIIKKIPLFKVHNNVIGWIKYHKMKVKKEFINILCNRTEITENRCNKRIEYASLFSDGKEVVGVVFDGEGNVLLTSSLLVEEELDTIKRGRKLPIIKLEFEIIKKEYKYPFYTRKEETMVNVIRNELDRLHRDKKEAKIKYLYFECFNNQTSNIDIAYQELLELIQSSFSNNHRRLYSIIQLSISS